MALTSDFNPSAPLVTYPRMRALLLESGGLQEGVIASGDLKVAQRAAGVNMSVDVNPGAAWVQIDTGTRGGLAHVYNDATVNVAVTASNATNPRVDQIILRYNDTSIPTGSGSVPTVEVLTGTATAGAQITNFVGANYRAGAATLPNDCLRLADVLVPAASSSVTNANIVDRRPWARGAHDIATPFTGGNTNITATTATALTAARRLECSGAPVIMKFIAQVGTPAVASGFTALAPMIDGTVPSAQSDISIVSTPSATQIFFGVTAEWPLSPSAGSHLFSVAARVSSGTGVVVGNASTAFFWETREDLRPGVSN